MNLNFVSEDKKTGRMTFMLKDTNPAFANAVRRAIIEEVPTMAIEDVEIVKNGSALYDEIIAHRLGMLPLSTDLKGYTPRDECDCKAAGCAKCTVSLTLKAKGPAIVLASELKSKDPAVKPVYGDMPIVQLLKGQELEIECVAQLGRGKEHIKWSPGTAWHEYEPTITIHTDKVTACKDKLPPQIYDKSGKIDKKLIVGKLVDACDGACDAVTIERSATNIMIHVEPWGQLSVRDMVTKALDILSERFTEFDAKFSDA